MIQEGIPYIVVLYQLLLHEKPYFPGPRISSTAQKDKVNIIFPSTFWLKKRSHFPSPKSSKQGTLGNQYIPSFHQLLDSKKDRISHHRKVQNKNFSVISKYHLFHQLLDSKKGHISHHRKVQNKDFSVISKYHLSIIFLAQKNTAFFIPKNVKTRTF